MYKMADKVPAPVAKAVRHLQAHKRFKKTHQVLSWVDSYLYFYPVQFDFRLSSLTGLSSLLTIYGC